MAWVKVDDNFCDHEKALQSGTTLVIWLEGLCYSNRHLTDGRLRTEVVRRFRLHPHPIKAASLLVAVGLWDKVDDGYQIHDYHEHYPTAAEIRAKRAADAARKRGGLRKESEWNPQGIQAPSCDAPTVDPIHSIPLQEEHKEHRPPAGNATDTSLRLVQRVLHDVLDQQSYASEADMKDALKFALSQNHITYDADVIRKALDSVPNQRKRKRSA